jgi:hypothetical protein
MLFPYVWLEEWKDGLKENQTTSKNIELGRSQIVNLIDGFKNDEVRLKLLDSEAWKKLTEDKEWRELMEEKGWKKLLSSWQELTEDQIEKLTNGKEWEGLISSWKNLIDSPVWQALSGEWKKLTESEAWKVLISSWTKINVTPVLHTTHQSYTLYAPYSKTNDPKEKEKTFRIVQYLGTQKTKKDEPSQNALTDDEKAADLLVVVDENLGW